MLRCFSCTIFQPVHTLKGQCHVTVNKPFISSGSVAEWFKQFRQVTEVKLGRVTSDSGWVEWPSGLNSYSG